MDTNSFIKLIGYVFLGFVVVCICMFAVKVADDMRTEAIQEVEAERLCPALIIKVLKPRYTNSQLKRLYVACDCDSNRFAFEPIPDQYGITRMLNIGDPMPGYRGW
jgi:hypothetical protein